MIAALIAMSLAGTGPRVAEAVAVSERAIYATAFDRSVEPIDAMLSDPGLDRDVRLALLIQKLRAQQYARLAGVVVGDEAGVRAEVRAGADATSDRDLRGRAELRLAVSRYFTLLLADDMGEVMGLAPMFADAAGRIGSRCPRAEALFFAALMPQIAGKIAESKPGLEAARQVAGEACPLERSYVDRHLAAVAEDAGDLLLARALAARSTALRRQIGYDIFLPFSLLLDADLAFKSGDEAAGRALLDEAARIAARLEAPAARTAACEEIGRHGLASTSCPPH
jgi:hypothetical protein